MPGAPRACRKAYRPARRARLQRRSARTGPRPARADPRLDADRSLQHVVGVLAAALVFEQVGEPRVDLDEVAVRVALEQLGGELVELECPRGVADALEDLREHGVASAPVLR